MAHAFAFLAGIAVAATPAARAPTTERLDRCRPPPGRAVAAALASQPAPFYCALSLAPAHKSDIWSCRAGRVNVLERRGAELQAPPRRFSVSASAESGIGSRGVLNAVACSATGAEVEPAPGVTRSVVFVGAAVALLLLVPAAPALADVMVETYVSRPDWELAARMARPFFLFVIWAFTTRLVMQWYPLTLSLDMFPFNLAYNVTEPLLARTRRLVPKLDGIDVSPLVWLAAAYSLNVALLGPDGLFLELARATVTEVPDAAAPSPLLRPLS